METKFMGVTSAEIQIRANGDGTPSRVIEGYAIRFGVPSVTMWKERGKEVVEVIAPEAITADLLAKSDIKMTMYHDMSRLLARSKQGSGTLSYEIDDKGVKFAFEAPETSYGDEALALVRRGDIDGCSFMFTTRYNDRECVERGEADGRIVNTVRQILGLYDFTLTPDPAYPQTQCEARQKADIKEAHPSMDDINRQIAEMRNAANMRNYY